MHSNLCDTSQKNTAVIYIMQARPSLPTCDHMWAVLVLIQGISRPKSRPEGKQHERFMRQKLVIKNDLDQLSPKITNWIHSFFPEGTGIAHLC